MKNSLSRSASARGAAMLVLMIVAVANVVGQRPLSPGAMQQAAERAQHDQKLQQLLDDKPGYALSIVLKWEQTARALGRWNETYTVDLLNALMKLDPENLLAAGEAVTYKGMMQVIATGRPKQPASLNQMADMVVEDALGGISGDLVYNPVTPCRVADTRLAGGLIPGNTARTFDLDGGNLSTQGGSATGCGIPLGVARAAVLTIVVTDPQGAGYFTAWASGPQPLSSALNYSAGQIIANTTVVPTLPGAGSDFTLYSLASAHAVIDVVGYFAASVATALDCTTVSSAATPVPVNAWTSIDASCPAGRTATGGGYDTPEGTLGYPGVWLTSVPGDIYGFNGWRTWVDNQAGSPRSIQTFVRCCRVPGR
jgi:hypothetical protein